MSAKFPFSLAPDVQLLVEFETERRAVVRYSLVLRVWREDRWHVVRVWDNAHGRNEMHRYTRRRGKQLGVELAPGEYGAAMRAAWSSAKQNYEEIIRAWESR